ncbi:DoxX [Tsuneonella dongtanensis]|uniref:DoxX n=1 Tax=Tsuneonella dongtanensis TaxID=692370 RepID=A0A1B2ACD5_9SPHN|nr:DoxX family protein [Tsuneonella dongtanensis]ANY19758.1 DoxX [Tsuneonella dongtanensis]
MGTLVHPGIRHHWDRLAGMLSSAAVEAAALLLTRLALGGVFWRSGRTKVVEGTWMELSDTSRFLFESEYAGVPVPAGLSAQMALWGETVLPILLVLGLATRLSALGLIGMTLVIQLFVYPEAWWPTHSLWAAMALVLVARGGGLLSLDHLLARRVVQ